MRRRVRIDRLLVAFLVASVVGLPGVAEAQRRRPPGPAPDRSPIRLGRLAPDFELPTLDSVLANITDGKVQEDRLKKVKLSAFRGKRAVCLMFTSCT